MADIYARKDEGFVLSIQERRPIPVSELVAILRDVDAAFVNFAQRTGGQARRLSVSVRPGSVELVWDVATQAWGARELLAPFATHLVETAASLLGYTKPDASAADLKAIESISKPVANGHARQINFVNNGEINFIINVGNASKIRAKARKERAKKKKTEGKILENSIFANEDEILQIESSLNRGDLVGTVFNLDRTWYARTLNGEGVLIPLRGRPEILAKLEHGEVFQLSDSTQFGSKKQLVAIHIDGADRLT